MNGAAPGGTARILVVEDDVPTRAYVTRALERAGFVVASEGAAAPALAALDEAPWSALLVDIGLPGASGFDLVREARRRRPEVPIALMTADASIEVAVQALRSEVDDFLPKPIAPDDLVRPGRPGWWPCAATRTTAAGRAGPGHRRPPRRRRDRRGRHAAGHRRRGDEVAILTLSHGQRGGDRAARAAEAQQAAALVGARSVLLDLEDTLITESDPTVGAIEATSTRSIPRSSTPTRSTTCTRTTATSTGPRWWRPAACPASTATRAPRPRSTSGPCGSWPSTAIVERKLDADRRATTARPTSGRT